MDNNEMNDTGAKKERWYQTTWFMWVMLVLFFPVGLFLMWKYKKHNLNARLIITAFFVLLMLGMPGTDKNTVKNDSAQQPTITTEQAKPEVVAEGTTETELEAEPEPPKKEEPVIPTEYKNALRKARAYGETQFMSKQRIHNQLTSEYGEQFSAAAADYAVNNVQLDYKRNALRKAKSYQQQQSMSKQRIYKQLTSQYGEQFTAEEAQYAIDNLDN